MHTINFKHEPTGQTFKQIDLANINRSSKESHSSHQHGHLERPLEEAGAHSRWMGVYSNLGGIQTYVLTDLQ